MRFHPFVFSSLCLWLSATPWPSFAGAAPSDEALAGEENRFAAVLNDLWIGANVKARLLRNEEVPGIDVDVDARDGVVTLFGMVPTLSAQAAADLEAVKVTGVHRIENLLEVVPEPRQEATRVHDRALERVVRERFETRPEIAKADLDVAICNSVARLRGSVENSAEHRAAVEIARDTAGVRQVVDQLQIDGKPASDLTAVW